jgi:hypothetical protein
VIEGPTKLPATVKPLPDNENVPLPRNEGRLMVPLVMADPDTFSAVIENPASNIVVPIHLEGFMWPSIR